MVLSNCVVEILNKIELYNLKLVHYVNWLVSQSDN